MSAVTRRVFPSFLVLVLTAQLAKLTSFFIILVFSLVAFAGLQYVAFGYLADQESTMLLSIVAGFHGALVRRSSILPRVHTHTSHVWTRPVGGDPAFCFCCDQGDVDILQNFHFARHVAPLFQLSFAVFVLILLFNLLIAVMSEGYEDVRFVVVVVVVVVVLLLLLLRGVTCVRCECSRSRTKQTQRGVLPSSK